MLDLSHNGLEDPKALEVFKQMPNLAVLNLSGNKLSRHIPNYRKTLINEIKTLSYLDDRPVFPKDRAMAEAFCAGGREAEREAREEFVRKVRQKPSFLFNSATFLFVIFNNGGAVVDLVKRFQDREKMMSGIRHLEAIAARRVQRDADGVQPLPDSEDELPEDEKNQTASVASTAFGIEDEPWLDVSVSSYVPL